MSCLAFLPGCAQFDQLTGKGANAVEPATTAIPAPPDAPEKSPVQAAEPPAPPAVTKKSSEPRPAPAGAAKDPLPESQAAEPAAPPAGVAKEQELQIKKTDRDKAQAEKEPLTKENKSRVASDRKSKKSPKPAVEPKPSTEDVFLPPVPLPSKPAAIGGSGG
jgi:hypothetical protein